MESTTSQNIPVATLLRDSSVQETWQQKLNQFPCGPPCPESRVVSDYNPITTPPRLLVGLFFDSYLRHINDRIPIFNEATLRHAIEAHYNGDNPDDNSA